MQSSIFVKGIKISVKKGTLAGDVLEKLSELSEREETSGYSILVVYRSYDLENDLDNEYCYGVYAVEAIYDVHASNKILEKSDLNALNNIIHGESGSEWKTLSRFLKKNLPGLSIKHYTQRVYIDYYDLDRGYSVFNI